MRGAMIAIRIALLVVALAIAGCSIPVEQPWGVEASPVRFSDEDRVVIREYYSAFRFPPELQDPDVVSPDLSRRLEISATLPPGIAAYPLPQELHRQLSPLPHGYERFRTGQDVVLMDMRTGQVVDLLTEVFSPALAQ